MSADITEKLDALTVVRELLSDIATALHLAHKVLDAGIDNPVTAELVCNELGRIGWMVERAQMATGEEGPLLVGTAEAWMLSDRVQEGLQALKA
jgi:hypothetical protein